MIRTSGIPAEPGDETEIQAAVEKVYRAPASERRLGLLVYWLPDRLRAGLRNWIRATEKGQRDGKYGHIWDNLEDEFSLAARQSVDYSQVKEERYSDLVQMHTYWTFGLFRQILDDPRYWRVPKTIVGEEIWSRVKEQK